MTDACAVPLTSEQLLDYLQGRLDDAGVEQVEQHYFGCAACTARLEGLAQLRAAVRGLLAGGVTSAAATRGWLQRARAGGLPIRSYHLQPGEQVACTAAPTDAFVAVHFGMPVLADEAVDLVTEVTDLDSGATTTWSTADVDVDRDAGEVVYLYSGAMVRALPRTRFRIEARLHGPRGERRLPPYAMEHTPWQQLDPAP